MRTSDAGPRAREPWFPSTPPSGAPAPCLWRTRHQHARALKVHTWDSESPRFPKRVSGGLPVSPARSDPAGELCPHFPLHQTTPAQSKARSRPTSSRAFAPTTHLVCTSPRRTNPWSPAPASHSPAARCRTAWATVFTAAEAMETLQGAGACPTSASSTQAAFRPVPSPGRVLLSFLVTTQSQAKHTSPNTARGPT